MSAATLPAAPRVIALDPSLTSTGYVDPAGTPAVLRCPHKGTARLAWYRSTLTGIVRAAVPDWAVIEGYAMSAHDSYAHDLGELGGVIRLTLADLGVPLAVIAPASLKMFATGKGNASKDAVLAEAVRRLGYAGNSKDEADALWLHELAMHALGCPRITLPAAHLRGLDKVRPQFETVTAP